MTFIQFSTTSKNNAERFLEHESFNYLKNEQRMFILNNLGDIRVLDPMMHGGGKISFERNDLLIEYVKLSDFKSDEYFMMRYGILNHNWELVKFGIEQGLTYYPSTTEKLIKTKNLVAIQYLKEKEILKKEYILYHLQECDFDFLLLLLKEFEIKKLDPSYLKKVSANQLLFLNKIKLFSLDDIKSYQKEKYLEIMKFKKIISEYNRSIKMTTSSELADYYKKEANEKILRLGFDLHIYK